MTRGSTAGGPIASGPRTAPLRGGTFPTMWSATKTWTNTADGGRCRDTATSGSRGQRSWVGRLIVTDTGLTSTPGAIPGLTTRPGAFRPSTTAAGSTTAACGVGGPV